MARLHDYRYEYKKMNFLQKPDYTTEITLRIYARYSETDVPHILRFDRIYEQYYSDDSNYVIADVSLSELLAKRDRLRSEDVFLANLTRFFQDRDC